MKAADVIEVRCPHGRVVLVPPSSRGPVGAVQDASPGWLMAVRGVCQACRAGAAA